MSHTLHRSAGAAAFVTITVFGVACGEKTPTPPRPAPSAPTSTNAGVRPSPAAAPATAPRATQSSAPAYPPYPVSDTLVAQYAALGVRLPPLRIIARRSGIDFPGFNVASDDAIPTWKSLRALTDKTGWYPLVVRSEHGMLENLDSLGHDSPSQILAAAGTVNVEQWIEERRANAEREWDGNVPDFRSPGATTQPNERFVAPYAILSGKPVHDVYIVLLPTTNPCEVPAYFPNGGWNECPYPEVQVAILRRWNAQYGTEPVTCKDDILEYLATRRPGTLDEAITLATEQFYYCEDIVTQGCESIDALADCLMKSDIWYFWWD